MSKDLDTIRKDIHDWILTNSVSKLTGEIPKECVVNSMQCLMLEVLAEGMTIIARNATSKDIWETVEGLQALVAWGNKHIANELGGIL